MATPETSVTGHQHTEGKRRRPSGERPPLPKHLNRSGKLLLIFLGCLVALMISVGLFGTIGPGLDNIEGDILREMSEFRTAWLTDLMEAFASLGSDWTLAFIQWATLVTLIVFKRFRHLFVYFGSLLTVFVITNWIANTFTRARPFEIDIIGHWDGMALPSRPVAAFAVTLLGVAYTITPPGPARSIAKWTTWIGLAFLSLSRMYLGLDHPIDLVFGATIGITIPVIAYRTFTPNEVFPVTYRKAKGAHLDIGGLRGEAIRTALKEQLGLVVKSMKPFGLAGSGGSTPILLTLDEPGEPKLFAKLYAVNHLRADRWYKLGRTLLYGRLEDEASFNTVTRLVQYEDYMLRVMRDAGLPSPIPYGFIVITPEREYLIVTEFFEGCKEILDAEITDEVIDSALRAVRSLWDAGVAHRDVKPSNILVRDSRVFLIDVAFAQVRPSPWREAVDLANMMIVLALRSDPDTIYERALRYFAPDEIGEAFAATRGVTMPSQSRGMLRKDGRDIVARFRQLAPKCRPISIQRWSWRRVGLTAMVVLLFFLVSQAVFGNLRGLGLFGTPRSSLIYAHVDRAPECRAYYRDVLILLTQSVPSAELLPCLETLPQGWSMKALTVQDGLTEMWIESDRAPDSPVKVVFTKSCDLEGATEVPSDEVGTERFEDIEELRDSYVGRRYYTFPGGCVVYHFDLEGRGRTILAEEAASALSFLNRDEFAQAEYEDTGNRI